MSTIIQHKKKLIFAIGIGVVVIASLFLIPQFSKEASLELGEEALFRTLEDPHTAFVIEAYEMIQKNYWNTITDEQLSELFRLAFNRATETTLTLPSPDEAGVISITEKALEDMSLDKKKEIVGLVVHLVLQNTEPFGRSALYTIEEEVKLRETVANINRDKNIYDTLELPKGATLAQVEEAYEEKREELIHDPSPEAQEKLEEIEYAKTVLGDEQKKELYDTTGQEPTVLTEKVAPNTLYMKIPVLSPQTFNEFLEVSESITDENLTTLILDLRGNIGGAIDTLQWFLGPFIGPNQYAYDFFKQGELTPYKTQFGFIPSLVKYKRVLVLIDKNSQSSAEVMAATFTRYNVGVLIGEPTKGWGTVENTFPLETKLGTTAYSLFLVHSITLRPDGEPIEGRGVDPMIYLSDEDWKTQLNTYFNDPLLTDTLTSVL